jgi:hypothetical protein
MRFERRGWEFKSLRVRQGFYFSRSLALLGISAGDSRSPLARFAHAARAPQYVPHSLELFGV